MPLRGLRVVEVGAGLGLVSAVLALLPPAHRPAEIVATDGDAALLPLTRKNILRNLEAANSLGNQGVGLIKRVE